jgi:peroxiredoxin
LDSVVEFQKFYKKSEKLKVGVLSINFDKESEKTKAFVAEKELTFPILFDVRGIVPELYKVEDYCFSVFIIDKEGIIRYISYESTPNIAEIIEAEIEKLRKKDEK